MVVLGIDPGIGRMGYGVVERVKGNVVARVCGCIETKAHTEQAIRLHQIHTEIIALLQEHSPDALAIEQLFFNTNVTTAMAVGRASGVVILAAQQCDVPVIEYTPLAIKMAVTGYGKADKAQMQLMITRLLGLSAVPKPDDAADALAVALCHAVSSRLNPKMANPQVPNKSEITKH